MREPGFLARGLSPALFVEMGEAPRLCSAHLRLDVHHGECYTAR
ncbi:MAG TPA: hypothetical protein PLJ35_03010 [Anaerolineae bacterium]|nr:hypothetical protein [Anaerolineae bacterium]HPL28296.1 hypothetical protein [Anaerolineae bacterium]